MPKIPQTDGSFWASPPHAGIKFWLGDVVDLNQHYLEQYAIKRVEKRLQTLPAGLFEANRRLNERLG